MEHPTCPKCEGEDSVKSGRVGGRQRFKCKQCGYYYSVKKMGKAIDEYYVVKALQLYLEGVSYREIERILGVSHVSVMNWVKKYRIKAPKNYGYRPTYKILNHTELVKYMAEKDNLTDSGMLINEVGDKFMVIRWERLKNR